MKQSLQISGSTNAGGGSGLSVLRIAFSCVAVVAVLAAAAFFLGQLRETVLMTSSEVRAAQAQQSVAEANYRTAQLARDTKAVNAQAGDQTAWQPWVDGAGHLAMLTVLGAVPLAVVGALVASGVLFRRHVSLPTVDGRVPVIGLDRELSREALFRYQEIAGGGRSLPRWSSPSGRATEALPDRDGEDGDRVVVLRRDDA